MNHVGDATTHELLTCFFSECERQFRFLEEDYGYMSFKGLTNYKKNCKITKPYSPQTDAPEPFFATARYEYRRHAIEIMYGDLQYILEINVYPNMIDRFSFRDLLDARQKMLPALDNLFYIKKPLQIIGGLQLFSQMIQKDPSLIQPSERDIQRANVMKNKLIEQNVREHFKNIVADACVEAAQAFLNKNYLAVINLLEPFEDYLGKADLKKLKISREKIS